MWKVTNIRNKDILTHFHEQVVRPLFELLSMLINAREKGTLPSLSKLEDLLTTVEFNSLTPMQQTAIQLVLELKADKVATCFDCFTQTIGKVSSTNLEKMKIRYENDYNQINTHLNFNLTKQKLPSELHTIFHTYLFKCMDVELLWASILPKRGSYSKAHFHKNFREENGVAVCPYCDIEEMTSKHDVQVEHFLPRNSFPLLSMAPLNLFSACDKCNSIYVKGARTKDVIITPLHENIGSALQFKKPTVGGPVKIKYNLTWEELHNYMILLKLEDRYNDEQLIQTLDMKLKSLDSYFSDISKHEQLSKGKVDLHFRSQTKIYALTLILSQLFRDYDLYKNAQ